MRTVLLFIIMIITLQVNAQVYRHNDGVNTRSIYRTYSDGYIYDNWRYTGHSTTRKNDISTNRSNAYWEREAKRSLIKSVYSHPSNSYSYSNNNYTDSKYSKYYVTTESLNVRSSTSSNSTLIGTLLWGENVNVIESYSNGWKKIKYTSYDSYTHSFKTRYGYVAGNYLSEINPNERYNYNTRYNTYNSNNNYSNSNTYSSNVYSSIKKTETNYGVGGLTIWTNCGTDGEIQVYIDGDYVGTLTYFFTNGIPKCNDSGTIFIEKPAGRYKLVAKGKQYTWSGTITITKNKCLIQGLEK